MPFREEAPKPPRAAELAAAIMCIPAPNWDELAPEGPECIEWGMDPHETAGWVGGM